MKPNIHAGRDFTEEENALLNDVTCDITKLVDKIPKKDISFEFLVLNTYEHERIEYCKMLTGKTLKDCSIVKLKEIAKKGIVDKKITNDNFYDYFYLLSKGVYRINFSLYKMFYMMVTFMYSNDISMIHFFNQNIIELYLKKKDEYLSSPNFELLKDNKLKSYTNIAMIYFTLCNSDNIIFDNDYFGTTILEEVLKEYSNMRASNAFDELNRNNFQNSVQFMLIKCMILLSKLYNTMDNKKIVLEMYDTIVNLKYFNLLPLHLQCGIIYGYCESLKKYGEKSKILESVKKQIKREEEFPLYYKAKFYQIISEDLRRSGKLDSDNVVNFFPILNWTIDYSAYKDDPNFKSIKNDKDKICYVLKDFTKCKYVSIFDKNLWIEISLLLIFNNLQMDEIKSLFYSEHYSLFSKAKLKTLLSKCHSFLLKLNTQETMEVIQSNHSSYLKFMKIKNNGSINFKNIKEYILFVSCFKVENMIELIRYVLREPYQELNREFVYLWEPSDHKCFVVFVTSNKDHKDLHLREKVALHLLKKFINVHSYIVEIER
uniref:Separase n=1 Tax=Parastrongyloides trichosuri TaxID=131310 RepID=A0A0N4ZTE8_PARTI